MQLSTLTADIQGLQRSKDAREIFSLTSDSREARPGALFAALPGGKVDGRDFIPQAIEKGAAAILAAKGTALPAGSTAVLIESANPRKDFALLAARFFGRQVPVTVAVTGTNGKSSTVNFCRQIWQTLDHAAASLGTIGITAGGGGHPGLNRPGLLTTPDPVVLHGEIAELEASGVTHLAFEASSIGIDQYRLDGVKIKAAAYTNLTRDHLDYHGTMEAYFDSKLRLFTEILPKDGVAVVNMDTPYSKHLADAVRGRGQRLIGLGRTAKELQLLEHKPLPHGQYINFMLFGNRYALELPLVGDFQAVNALTALGLVIAEDPDNASLHMRAVYALEKLQSVRGRLEFAATHASGAGIYVDYAHTPDGLETMLKALRPHASGRLHVVFGCGGDRDRGKRPMMGAIATRLADRVIVTDDNPRTEDAATVRSDIMAGAGPSAAEIAGRRAAIRAGVAGLQSGDVLVIAGKGHEQGQIVGKDVLPFDDVTEAVLAVRESAA